MDPEPVAQEEPHTQGTPASASASTSEFDFEFDPVPPTGYTPTAEDVFVVQGILTHFAPPELGLSILSLADFEMVFYHRAPHIPSIVALYQRRVALLL